ncbi:efflux RND transporter periplasmic adaptor subunit [Segnochrobactraceae bacterium EtOH-i3]
MSVLRPAFRARLLATAFVAGLAGVPGAAAFAADAAAPAQPRPPSITVAPAASGTVIETAVVTGTLMPREEVLVIPEIDGISVQEILAEEGDRVTAGQVLARLSQDSLKIALTQNDAQIQKADAAIAQAETALPEYQANYEQAQKSFERARELNKSGVTSADVYEQRQALARAAFARLNASQEALRLAKADKALSLAQRDDLLLKLARTEIKAPTAGVISRRTARVGAVVGTASEPLFRIIEDGAIELEAAVPETVLARLAAGQPAEVLPAGRDAPVSGRVRLVSPEVNAASRLGRVRIALDSSDGLAIGAFGRARVETARRQGIVVPLSAILYGHGGTSVQVVKDGVVDSRPVSVALQSSGQALLTDGVTEGESVVVVSGTFLRDGDRVTPVAAEAPPQ